jgi:hypothetical protein
MAQDASCPPTIQGRLSLANGSNVVWLNWYLTILL